MPLAERGCSYVFADKIVDRTEYVLAYEEEDEIAADLEKRVEEGEIDLIITTGTSAGVFVKDLNLPVPMIDFSATDPVASGIIDSATEGSGNPNVWAQVEPSLPLSRT